MLTYRVTTPVVGTGTPCPHDDGFVCSAQSSCPSATPQAGVACNPQACVSPPPPPGSTCNPADPQSCSNNGVCGEQLDGRRTCFCGPGYSGVTCAQMLGCGLDCAGQNRQACVQNNVCGPCLPGWGEREGQCTMRPAIDPSKISVNDPPHPIKFPPGSRRLSVVTTHSERRRAQTNTQISTTVSGGPAPSFALDGNLYTHWIVDFDPTATLANKPTINVAFTDPTQVTHYTLMSGNSFPQQDPKSWRLYCRKTSDPNGNWELIDEKADQLFASRHETRTFQCSPAGNIYPQCDEISIVVTQIRDAAYQGGAAMSNSTMQTTNTQRPSFTPKVQLAEVAFFTDTSVMNPAFSTTVTEEGFSTGEMVLSLVGVGLLGICCALLAFALYLRSRQHLRAHIAKIDELGFSLEDLPTREEIEELQKGKVTSDIEEAFLQTDRDHSNAIDKSELTQLLQARGFALSTEYVDGLWASFDTDGSNTLDMTEFAALMKLVALKTDKIDADHIKPEVDTAPDLETSSKGKLYVFVLSADGLPKADTFGRNDPYAIVDVNGVTSKTSVCFSGGAVPVWGRPGTGDRLCFLCAAPPSTLQIKVLDDDFNPADMLSGVKSLHGLKKKMEAKIGCVDDPIGAGVLDLSDWDGQRKTFTIELQQDGGGGSSAAPRPAGAIKIRCAWLPPGRASVRASTPERGSAAAFEAHYAERTGHRTATGSSPARKPPPLPELQRPSTPQRARSVRAVASNVDSYGDQGLHAGRGAEGAGGSVPSPAPRRALPPLAADDPDARP
jgi:hypothetical protein